MKKSVTLLFLGLIIVCGDLFAQPPAKPDSSTNAKSKMERNNKTDARNTWQDSMMWYRRTDSVMIPLSKMQRDSMMQTMNKTQRDGYMKYRNKMQQDSLWRNKNNIQPDSLMKQ